MFIRLFDAITRLSLRYRWIVLIVSLVILGAGIYSAATLNLELLPRIEFPQTVLIAQWSDAESAEQFLQEITVPLEEMLEGIDGIVNVESTTTKSFAFVIARNEFGLDQDRIVTEIEEASRAIPLPEGVEDPQVVNFSLSDLPVVVASASSSDLTLPELKELVTSDLKKRLEDVEQISQVTVSGGQELPEETPVEEESVVDEEPADPGRLPLLVIQGAKALDIDITHAQDVTPEFLAELSDKGTDEQVLSVLRLIPQETLRFAPPDTLALLPIEYMSELDPEIQTELDTLAAEQGGINQFTLAEARAILQGAEPEVEATATAEPTATTPPVVEAVKPAEIPEVEPVALPQSWVDAAAQMGQELKTTAELTVEVMGAIVSFAPQMLNDLEPSMWRAINPDAAEIAVAVAEDSLDASLLAQLEAIGLATNDEQPEPVMLPASWVQAAGAAGFQLETTADVPPEAMGLLSGMAPQLLDDLTEEMILAFSPDQQAALPESFVSGLDEDLQETLEIVAIRHAAFQASQSAEQETELAAEPTATPDPARLPDLLIQGARSFGIELEYAYDITPDFMRQVSAFGPQGLQILQTLTPDNLRSLQPEVIGLLPTDFLATLDEVLIGELDDLAAEFGGAGQLAVQEAEEVAVVDADAPPLSGIWLEPGPNGEPSQFQTAADLLENPFVPTAAMLLNFFPDSPQVENPVDWMAALTPDVLAYLAENEEGFVSELSPVILEMMSPEALTFLLDNYPGEFEPDVAERLRAIAAGTVSLFVPEATITRTDGDPSLILALYKDGDANTVEVAHRVFDELAAYEGENPKVSFSLVFEQASFIEESIEGVSREGLLGAVFAIVVILIFLSGRVSGRYKPSWRATIVVGVSIPLSVFSAFLFMRIFPPTLGDWINGVAESTGNDVIGFIARLFPVSVTLNIMTLSGMTVAVGRVVDDSIVVLENTYRFIQQGDDPRRAVLNGTREVAIAIFASTATTVAVFMPLGLLGGIIGSFFLPFGLTVTYALASSFVVAITVVPALTFMLIRKEHIPEERETALQRRYTPILRWSLGHRGLTMLVATVIFVISLYLLQLLPRSFIPEIGEPTVNTTIQLPGGTQMADTDVLVKEFESSVEVIAGIERVQSEVGSAGGVESFFGGGSVSQNQANITISVESQDELDVVTNAVRQQAEAIFGEENVVVSAASQASFGGFSLVVTADSMTELEPAVADIKAALAVIDIDEDGRHDIVNISSNVDEEAVGGNGTIVRVDGKPAISFSGELETENTLGVTAAAKEAVATLETLPAGVEVTEGFESEQQTQGFREMVVAITYSIIIVYLIMAFTFRSLIHPFTILFSLPFALVGAALALFISNSVLGISAMIGLMMLVGIVVTNAIVLLELVQQLRSGGKNAYDSLMEGGRTRLRPIWMTALAAALALFPLAISKEGGAIIASELAITVIGGLLVSTALTLLVVPVVYSLFDDAGAKLRRRS